MVEMLVYIGVLAVVLGLAYAALYRCMNNSVVLRYNAEDITRALDAGERWRADIRAAGTNLQLEASSDEQILQLPGSRQNVAYRFSGDTLFRRVGSGPWVSILGRVKHSSMEPDVRRNVTAWRWELELEPRSKATIKPGRVRPLFTFLAVPGTSP
jgi:hypothetical protein